MFSKKRAGTALALFTGAALVLAGCAGGSTGGTPDATPTFDPDEEVTLDLAFWGNDIRAELYNLLYLLPFVIKEVVRRY